MKSLINAVDWFRVTTYTVCIAFCVAAWWGGCIAVQALIG